MSLIPTKCQNCGNALPSDDASFCMYCGNKLLLEKEEKQNKNMVCSPTKLEDDNKKQLFHIRAEQHLSENNLEEAGVIYKRIIDEIDPCDGAAWWGLFKIVHGNFNIENKAKIIAEFMTNAGGIEKADFTSLYDSQTSKEWNYAMKYSGLAEKEKYNNEFNDYIKNRIAALYTERGLSYAEKHKYKVSIADFTEAIKWQPESSRNVYWYRGLSYYEKKEDYIAAINDFTKCIEMDASDADFYEMRGKCYYLIDRYDLALVDFNKVIELRGADEIILKLRNRAAQCSSGEISGMTEKELLKKLELCLNPKSIILIILCVGLFLSLGTYLYDAYELNTLIAEKNVKKIVEKMAKSDDPKKFTDALIKIGNDESLNSIKSKIAYGEMSYPEEQRLYAIKILKEKRIKLPGEIDFYLLYRTSLAESAKNKASIFDEANKRVAQAYLDYLTYVYGTNVVVAEYLAQIKKAPLTDDGGKGLVSIVLKGDSIIALADYAKREKFNELKKIVMEIEPFVNTQGDLFRRLEVAKSGLNEVESELNSLGGTSGQAYYTSENDRLYQKALHGLMGYKDKDMIDASDPSRLSEAQRKDYEKQKRIKELYQKKDNMMSELRKVNEELSKMSRVNNINFLLSQVQSITREW